MKTRCFSSIVLAAAFVTLCVVRSTEAASVSASNLGNVTIPDGSPGAWVSSQIAISGAPAGAVVTGIDVYFRCVHTYSGDLVVDLNADSTGSLGNRNLWNREGGSADNPTRTTTGITTFNGLSVNRTWYLYARDYATGDSGYIDEWTITVYYSTPPLGPPNLVSPGTGSAPGSTLSTTTPTFQWQSVSGADGYALYISRFNGSTYDLIYDSSTVGGPLTGTSYTLPSGYLQEGNQYRWNMATHNSAGYGSPNASRLYFNISVSPLPPPTLVSPGTGSAPGSSLSTTTPTFQWQSVAGADGYALYISKFNGSTYDLIFDSSTIGGPLTGTSYTLPSGYLQDGSQYRWNMATHNSAGYGTPNASRLYFNVSLPVTPLPPPTLVSPGTGSAPGSTISTTTPQFQWQAVAGADGYALYISKFNGSTYDLIYDSSAVGGPLPGTSYTLPSGYLLSGGQYRWNMATHNGAGYGTPNASRLYFTVAASSAFYLSFPLQYSGWTPYTAQITTVFDHAMSSRYSPGGGVVAYTGEAGTVADPNEPPVNFGNGLLYSFKKADGTPFVVNGHYVGTATTGNTTLNYDGHPGYDFPVPVGTDVYAAADGQVIVTDANTTAAGNYVRIQHADSGYQSQYLHLSQILVSVGQAVSRGQLIGKSGNTAGPSATVSPHLHFEVKKGTGSAAIAVDPYGWEGSGADPYTSEVNVNLWNPILPPCAYSISPSGNVYSSAASSGSFNVTTSAGCSWTATTGDSWITITSGSSGSGNGSVNYSLSANAGASARTGTINVQGRLFAITQAGVGTPVGYPSATWKGPAAAGNYETGRSGNPVAKIIVHTTEGSAQSALDRFQTSGEIASAHYIISTAGVVWQVVADADTAYHAGNYAYNQQSIGIELEGYADGNPTGNFSWQTDAQFTALQNLIAWLLSQYSIPLDRAHIIGHNQVPSPGSPYPPTTQWGGASNHYDNGAWWNWRRLMTALGHAPSFAVVQVQSGTSLTTLPQAGAPIISPAAVGQRFVAYDSYGGYYLVFVSGSELPQQNLPAGGEFHWDAWIPAANVTLPGGATQLEVNGVFPTRLNIRNAAGTTGTTVVARTIDGKRYVATGNTANADGYSWREFYIGTTANAVATGWAITDNLTVVGGGGGPSSPTIANPKLSGTTFTLSVPTQVGFNYVLEYKNSVNEASWIPVQTNNGSGGMIGLTNNGATEPSRIYRVRVN